jgi:hypothetical protein
MPEQSTPPVVGQEGSVHSAAFNTFKLLFFGKTLAELELVYKIAEDALNLSRETTLKIKK